MKLVPCVQYVDSSYYCFFLFSLDSSVNRSRVSAIEEEWLDVFFAPRGVTVIMVVQYFVTVNCILCCSTTRTSCVNHVYFGLPYQSTARALLAWYLNFCWPQLYYCILACSGERGVAGPRSSHYCSILQQWRNKGRVCIIPIRDAAGSEC
jgi:hypothetical protein